MKEELANPTIEQLRQSLSDLQKALLNSIVQTRLRDGTGIPLRLLHSEFGTSTTQAALRAVGGAVVQEVEDYSAGNRYRPTLLGVMLSERGEDHERLLVRYLDYLEFLFRTRPEQLMVNCDEVRQHLDISEEESRQLITLIELGCLWSHTANPHQDPWQAGVLKESEQLSEWPSKKAFLHHWIFRNYNPKEPVYLADRYQGPLAQDSPSAAKLKRTSKGMRKRDFFISYNKKDAETAQRIQTWLDQEGYSTFMQEADFHSGSNFVLKMDEGMKTTHRTLAVLSKHYLNSLFTYVEWAEAFSRDPRGERGILVPVRIDECEVEGILSVTTQIRIEKFIAVLDWDRARKLLLDRLASLPSLKGKRVICARSSRQISARSTTPDTTPARGQIAVGNNIAQAGGDIHQHFYPKVPKKRTALKPREGTVSAEQALQIRMWIGQLVEGTVGMSRGAAFAMWWARFQNRFQVSEYKELPANRFPEVEPWYRQQAAIETRSLRKRAPDAWRKARYVAIHQAMQKLGCEKEAFYAELSQRLKMRKPFSSLTELTKRDLERVYALVLRDTRELRD